MKGYVQVYTGNGKGKTTASFGLALRAVGAGFKVFIGQFVKGMAYSELNAFETLSHQVTIKQYGQGRFIKNKPAPEDIESARAGLEEIRLILAEGEHQLVILDEANIATYYQMFSVDELLDVINSKHDSTELVITGRYADPKIIERADLVTEMCEIKHYFSKGIQARTGIEK